MKPKIFIGSSSESIHVAKTLGNSLSDNLDVKIWDGAFSANEFFLERLQKELFLTDYALFVIAPDDRINKRGRTSHTTRDNVIFELGMFIGALGLKKAYFVVVELVNGNKTLKLELPSDLDGINRIGILLHADVTGKIADNERNNQAIAATAEKLKKTLTERTTGLHLNLLPSTPLAIGYYRNFILQACKELSNQRKLVIKGQEHDLSRDNYDFFIIIPDKGSDASHEAYQKFVRQNGLIHVEIKPENPDARPYPFFIGSEVKEGRLQLFDLPTTLRASREAIKLVMPTNTDRSEIVQLELKEIHNFRNTIEFLLNEPESDGFCDNIHLISASTLFKI